MRKILALTIAASLPLALGGCQTTGEPQGGPTFTMVNTAGQPTANVRMWQTPGGVTFRISGAGLPHGNHGLHVHSVGRCDAPDFTTAGGHWNPTSKQHGTMNPAGPHEGDLPNLIVGTDGRGTLAITIPGATMAGLLDADGSAMVVHASADDLRTDPSGNSGGRIVCGVFRQT